MSTRPVILTGIRANNDLHIGNYFGALMPLIRMALAKSDSHDINLFIPDLHSFTTPIDHRQLLGQTFHNLKIFAAAGLPLDKPSIRLYRQSFVPAHSELTWILDCFTGFGEMSRMTQFKDKSQKLANNENDGDDQRISVGLFNYPVLMAADILLYGASYVPVGEDQSQHLEFTRDLAERMNSKFSTEFPEGLFVIPRPVQEQHVFFGREQGLRIRDLQNPTKKMSKSDNSEKGIIFLGDDPDSAYKKIMSAETDSIGEIKIDYVAQPGITNLLNLLELLGGNADDFIGSAQYGPLKKRVAELTKTFLEEFQNKLDLVDDDELAEKLKYDETLMRETSNYQLYKVQQAVGLRPLDHE